MLYGRPRQGGTRRNAAFLKSNHDNGIGIKSETGQKFMEKKDPREEEDIEIDIPEENCCLCFPV